MTKQSPATPEGISIINNDGKLLYCPCQAKPWKQQLETLFAEFRTEDNQKPPKEIIPFDNERIVRFLAGNGKPITDKDFVAYGMATLVLANHGTGARYVGHVDDIFVSQSFRHQGIGKEIMHALIAEATRRDLIYLELHSNPTRVIAHQLYENLGFRLIAKAVSDSGNRGTDVFCLPLRTI